MSPGGVDLSLLLAGLVAGFVGGYAGIGGAPILVAVAVVFLDFDQYTAQGTVLAVMLGPMTLPAVVAMWDRVRANLGLVAIGFTTYALSSYVGALGAFAVGEGVLRATFAALLALLGLEALVLRTGTPEIPVRPGEKGTRHGDGPLPVTLPAITAACCLVGVVGGFWGIGAGVLMVPVFVRLFHMHKDDARAVSLAILLPPVSLPAVLAYHGRGSVRWGAAVLVFVGYFASNFPGARLGRAHDPARFRRGFGVVMLLLAASYVLVLLRGS